MPMAEYIKIMMLFLFNLVAVDPEKFTGFTLKFLLVFLIGDSAFPRPVFG